MIPDSALEQMANELILYGEEFIKNKVQSEDVLNEAIAVVREAVKSELAAHGYDMTAKFNLALVSKSIVITEMHGDILEFIFVHDFKDETITKTWENKDSSGESSIQSSELAEIINDGRGAFTIEGGANTGHGFLAIPPAGEEYDPNNKNNTIVKKIKMPAKEGVYYIERAKDALEVWVYKKHDQLVKEFKAGIENLVRRNTET